MEVVMSGFSVCKKDDRRVQATKETNDKKMEVELKEGGKFHP